MRSFSVAVKLCHYVKLVLLVMLMVMMPIPSTHANEGTPEPAVPAPALVEDAPSIAPEPVVPVAEPPLPPAPGDQGAVEPDVPAIGETSAAPPPASSPSTPDVPIVVTPDPTVAPSPTIAPTPVPSTISWSQPEPIQCAALVGNAQSLAVGDSATWRCETAIQADVAGDLPNDLHILWTVNAGYTGDDVRIALPEDSIAAVHQADVASGGMDELVVFRTSWIDGQVLTFDVTVARTTCAVGESFLSLSSQAEVATAATIVQITRFGEPQAATHLTITGSPNLDVPTVSIHPVSFGAFQWSGRSWGTSQTTAVIDVKNDGCFTSSSYLVSVQILSSDPGVQPIVLPGPETTTGVDPLVYQSSPSAIIAQIQPGFQGSGQILVGLELTPDRENLPGKHDMAIEVTVVAAP